MTKKSKQKFKYLENQNKVKRAFKIKWKAFFIILKVLERWEPDFNFKSKNSFRDNTQNICSDSYRNFKNCNDYIKQSTKSSSETQSWLPEVDSSHYPKDRRE